MNNPNSGGPAFPSVGSTSDDRAYNDAGDLVGIRNYGMTLRDYFAAKVMGGFQWSTDCDYESNLRAAKVCYSIADAMLAAREIKS